MNTEYKNVAAILVFNDAGQLALQLRAAHDESFPSHWDFSAGGGIEAGETPEIAAKKELREELGIDADISFITADTFTYPAWDPTVTRQSAVNIFQTRHNGPFKPDPTEVDKVEFFGLNEIEQMIKAGEKFHPEFLIAWGKGIVNNAASHFAATTGRS